MEYSTLAVNLTSKIFQCKAGNDPLGFMSEKHAWESLNSNTFERKCQFMVWMLTERTRNWYLSGPEGLIKQYEKCSILINMAMSAESNRDLHLILGDLEEIINFLDLSPMPHIDYEPTNSVHLD